MIAAVPGGAHSNLFASFAKADPAAVIARLGAERGKRLLAMVAMTGRVNSSPWSIFAPGEALFLGGEGGEDAGQAHRPARQRAEGGIDLPVSGRPADVADRIEGPAGYQA